LRENDCDAIQGYLVHRPVPAEDIGPDIFMRPLIPHLRRPSLTA
jgi:EAL domain-containing protein (putative c-di-GMP-specific phosphodiesterase class I)